MSTRFMHATNTIWATQLATLALVLHLWMDMMGDFEAGGELAGVLMIAALLILIAPALETAYHEIRV